MGLINPIILEEIKGVIQSLRNRTRNTGQVYVFASHAEALIGEQNLQNTSVRSINEVFRTYHTIRNPMVVNTVHAIVTEVASALLSNEEATPIDINVNQDDRESTILKNGAAKLRSLVRL
jgi:hypothetical protein